MREANVVGFIPSNSAAPLGPDTFPFALSRAVRMLSASNRRMSAAVNSRLFSNNEPVGFTGRAGPEDGKLMVSRPLSDVITARSIAC